MSLSPWEEELGSKKSTLWNVNYLEMQQKGERQRKKKKSNDCYGS